MSKELPKAYTPTEYEDEIYKKWEESGYFNPDNLDLPADAPNFVVSMPPPNATGVLHVGHTLGLTVQDIMIRYHRMKGDKTLWVPGVDHAAIATQNVVEKLLKKEGTSRHELGREKFLAKVTDYVMQSKATIENQTRKMGSSCDWSREGYTMSDKLNRCVNLQFKNMYDDGLIYRGDRIVNWCPRCQSTLSDDEVEHTEQKTKLYTFKYSKDFPITIATTRPETKLGDTAVAVNPDDERYKKYIGQEFSINFAGIPLTIRVISDREVDPEFGTGALGVTPAHSAIDWKMAEDNNLKIVKVIGQDGKILAGFGEFSGLKVKEAQEKIVEKIRELGLMEKEEEIDNNLAICYRCGTSVEPLPSLQWFVAVDKEFTIKNTNLINKFGKNKTTLKEISKWAVESGEIKIIPDKFEKIYFHWMNNLRDWCISRQIWFGHRIPAWYKNGEIKIEFNSPGKDWEQDRDTLDTWFSSALWTWSTLLNGKYEKFDDFESWFAASPDFMNFHPTQVMETMHDILFFWVARMIIMTLYTVGDVPFRTVYLHGMVCDKNGKKMSKSKPETCIEPIEVSKKYGTDALRLSLIVGNSAGNKLSLAEQKIAGFRNFANKLWNIGRFIQMMQEQNPEITNLKSLPAGKAGEIKNLTLADKWITSRLNTLIQEVTDHLENFQFSLAGEKLYNFAWKELADWYLEIAKIQNNQNTYFLLLNSYFSLLKLLHPFTPFVTETIWSYFNDSILMIEKWPESSSDMVDQQAEQDMNAIQELITQIRSWRKENKKEPKDILKATIVTNGKDLELIQSQKEVIEKLTKLETTIVKEKMADDLSLQVGNTGIIFA